MSDVNRRGSSAREDRIELAATVLLSLATIVAAWSAYQSTRWSGIQADAFSEAGAKRTLATQQAATYAAQVQLDALAWITFLEHFQEGDESGATFLRARFRAEFVPAFEAWAAQVPEGEVPPGTPFELPEYRPHARLEGERLNVEAEAAAATGRAANQIGDNFVLVAVVMASVLFCSGVGTKVRSQSLRLSMLLVGFLLFLGGTAFMLSLPQDLGL